jgi:hypothetical protein
MRFIRNALIALFLGATIMLTGCDTDATVASRNLSKAAEQFEVQRRIVFYNGFTDEYILSVEGRCSLEIYALKVMVTCKTDDDEFVKHYFGRSDNTVFFAEQLEASDVSTGQYRVIFKPTTIVPDIDIAIDLK